MLEATDDENKLISMVSNEIKITFNNVKTTDIYNYLCKQTKKFHSLVTLLDTIKNIFRS